MSKPPRLTPEALRNASILMETDQPSLALDLLEKYSGTDLLKRHLDSIKEFSRLEKEAINGKKEASDDFLKCVKQRQKRMEKESADD